MTKTRLTLALALILPVAAAVAGTTHPAATAGLIDVRAAFNACVDGDILQIPAGTVTWNDALNVGTKRIQIKGAGWDSTVITTTTVRQAGAAPGARLFTVNLGTTGQMFRLSDLQIKGISGQSGNVTGIINLGGTTNAMRIDHIKTSPPLPDYLVYTNPANTNISALVDHCIFNFNGSLMRIHCPSWPYPGGRAAENGDGAWADDPYPATEKGWVMEDNVFLGRAADGRACIDGDYSQRMTIRHNFIQSFVTGHGTESGQRRRGMRWFEVYDNYITPAAVFDTAVEIRSGSGLVFNNDCFNGLHTWNSVAKITNHRMAVSFSPWGGATGVNPWDSNTNGVYASGTCTAAGSLTMTDSSKNWTTNQWKDYTLRRLGGGSGNNYGFIISNTNNTITYSNALGYSVGNMVFIANSAYDIRKVDVQLDECGRGKGDILSGGSPSVAPINEATSSISWPNQAAEGIYQWNNFHGTAAVPIVGTISRTTPGSVLGREFFNSSPVGGGGIFTAYPWNAGATARRGPPQAMMDAAGVTTVIRTTTTGDGGGTYPHSLQTGVTTPDIIMPGSANFIPGATPACSGTTVNCVSITTSGFSSTPTLSIGAWSPSVSNVNLTDLGNGTGTISGTATGTSVGSYTVTVTATAGAQVVNQSFNMVITSTNPAPTSVAITSPLAGATFTAPATIILNATASDDGTITKMEFYSGGSTLIGTVLNDPTPTFTWTGVAAGSYSLTVKAYDNGVPAATTISPPVAITVNAPISATPTPPANIIVKP